MPGLIYLLYAAVLIAAVLAIEGVWLAVRGLTGSARDVNRRLALVRKSQDERAGLKLLAPGTGMAAVLDTRLPTLKRALWAARAPISSAQLLAVCAIGWVIVAGVLLFFGASLSLALGAAVLSAILVPALGLKLMAARRRAKFLAQLPQAVDLIARSLQAGHPVTSAFTAVAKQMPDPIGTEFGLVIDEMTYGLDRDEALENLALREPSPEIRMFVASLQVTRETGGNLAEVFLKLSEIMRAKAQLRMKVSAISAEGRMSFWVVSALPLVVIGAVMVLRPEYYTEVMHDPLFWPLMSGPPVSLALGAVTIWRMVNIRV